MDSLKIIEKLAGIARREPAPKLDVSADVLRRITEIPSESVSLLPLDIFAGVSAFAASVIAFFSTGGWYYIMDPLSRLFVPIGEIPLW